MVDVDESIVCRRRKDEFLDGQYWELEPVQRTGEFHIQVVGLWAESEQRQCSTDNVLLCNMLENHFLSVSTPCDLRRCFLKCS